METTRRSFFATVASVAALACVAPKLLAERTYSADVKGLVPETPKRLQTEVFDYDVYRGLETGDDIREQRMVRRRPYIVSVIGTPKRLDKVYVWTAASIGSHVVGGFEAEETAGSTVLIPDACFGEPVGEFYEVLVGDAYLDHPWKRIPGLEAVKNGQMFRLCGPPTSSQGGWKHVPAREFDGSFGEKWYGIAVGDGGLILNDRKDSANRGHMEGFAMADFYSTFDSALAAYIERRPGNWVATPTQPVHHATLPGALDFNHGESLA